MQLKMIKSVPGVNDGDIYPTEYKAGEIVDVGDELGAVFLNEKFAVPMKSDAQQAGKSTKNKGNAPENKGNAPAADDNDKNKE